MDLAKRPPSLRITAPARRIDGRFAPQAKPRDHRLYHDDHKPIPARRANHNRRLTQIISAGCVLLVAGMIGWFLVQTGIFEDTAGPFAPAKTANLSHQSPPSTKKSTMASPVFAGFDKHKQPYSVSAKSARRNEDNPTVIFLNKVSGQMKRPLSGELLLMSADDGIYKSDSGQLELDGNIQLISAGKYFAQTSRAKVNMPEKRLRSDAPVSVVFSSGTITANGVELWDAGERILFFNGVSLHIAPQNKKGAN